MAEGNSFGGSRAGHRFGSERYQWDCGDLATAIGIFEPQLDVDQDRSGSERKGVGTKILAAFSLVRTDRNLYAFRGANGLWFEDALGVREQVTRFHSTDYGAVFITNERVIGFTPLLGSFSSKPLDVHERIVEIGHDNGLILVSTTRRTLVLGSRLSGWEEFE